MAGREGSGSFAHKQLIGRANYMDWKFAMKMNLIKRDLWDYVDGTTVDTAKDAKALSYIVEGVSETIFNDIRDLSSGKEAWKVLGDTYEDKGITRKVSVIKELVNTRYSDCRDMADYLHRAISAYQELKTTGVKPDEELIAGIILANLPDRFEPLIMALKNCGEVITVDNVKNRLLAEGNKTIADNGRDSAFVNKRFEGKGSFKGKCFRCNLFGHKSSECTKAPRYQKGENKFNKKGSGSNAKGKEAYVAEIYVANTNPNPNIWYMDSCASFHMTPHKELIDNYKNASIPHIKTGSSVIEVEGVGNVAFSLNRNGEKVNVTFSNVLYVPKLTANLLSIKYLNKNFEMVSTFTGEKCSVYKGNHLVATGTGVGDHLYSLDLYEEITFISMQTVTNELLHQRLGHLSEGGMMRLKDMVEGFTFNGKLLDCVSCIKGKMHRQPFPKGKAKRAKELLGIVHTDLCGPMSVSSIGGSRYFISFIDDLSRMTFVYFLKNKSEVFETFKTFQVYVERQTGKPIKVLRSDNGTEYVNSVMDSYLESKGIQHQKSIPYTPEQMGVAERNNRTLVERARSMLVDAHLDRIYWAEAVKTATHCKNLSPTIAVSGMTPYEKWNGDRPDIGYLRVFGCRAFMHIPKQKRSKWDIKADELMLVGYCEDRKGYRLINPTTFKIVNARDVHFLENKMYHQTVSNESNFYDDSLFSGSVVPKTSASDTEDDIIGDQNNEIGAINEDFESDHSEIIDHESTDAVNHDQEGGNTIDIQNNVNLPELTRPSREIRRPDHYQDFDTNGMPDLQMPNLNRMCFVKALAAMTDDIHSEPKTIDEALNGVDSDHWKDSIAETISGHIKNKTWEIVDCPTGKNIVDCKWVFKVKNNSDGQIERYKTRLVAKGFSQIEGIDYNETFSPVVRYVTLRVLLAYAAIYDWEIDQMDAVMAFVQGTLSEEIYMKVPDGITEYYQENLDGKVLKLHKALDGLKQSGRLWYQLLEKGLVEMGFKQSSFDSCAFIKTNLKKELVIITIYVDDLLIFSNSIKLKKWVKEQLMKRFEMKDLGTASYCLGIKIERDRKNGSISLNQTQYLENTLNRYNMQECHAVTIPLDPNQKLSKGNCKEPKMANVPYQAAVGSLLYAAQATRPDITYAVNFICQFCNDPQKPHWAAVKRIMRYLRGSTACTLSYSRQNGSDIVGYCDSNYGGDVGDRRSTTGYTFLIGGGAVSWCSKRQPTVATSTTEAEYMALSAAAKEAMWLRKIQGDIGLSSMSPIVVYCDNNGAVNLSKNSVYHGRTKHIDIQHHFVRDSVKLGHIVVQSVSTSTMISDYLTKAVPRQKHEMCARAMGLAY